MNPALPPPPVPWYTHPRFNRIKRALTPTSSSFSEASTPSPPPIRKLINAVYYPNWRVYLNRPPSSMPLTLISHIFYAFLHVDAEGTIIPSDEYADTQISVDSTNGLLSSLPTLKAMNPHLKIILSIGGGGRGSANFAAIAMDSKKAERFAESARVVVDEYELDGIDLDWEHPDSPALGYAYLQLLHRLRSRLPRPRYILTSALPAGEWALQNIPLAETSSVLDLINLMAYDFTGPWTPKSGHHARLYSPRNSADGENGISGDAAVRYLQSRGVPSEKILLGIPAYGRSFLGCRDVAETPTGHGGDEGTFEFRELPRPGASEHVDLVAVAAYCVGGDGGFVTY
ncbi:glycoside hydrolase, partial [Ascodesmis nigricans]